MPDTTNSADLLLAARRDPASRPADLPAPPADEAEAYAVQAAVQAQLGPIGGWKVGAPTPSTFSCAPLPLSGLMASPAVAREADCPDRAVEAEIAVRMGADLPVRDEPYSRAEVIAAIASAHPAIEVLQSRFVDAAKAHPLSALADSLSHHGLVYGPAIADWQGVDLDGEAVDVVVEGTVANRGRGNPAGEMVRLVQWVANHGARWAGGLKAGQFVTTGSWTGKDKVPPGGTARIVFARCGSVEVRYG